MNFNDYQQAALQTNQHGGDTALLALALGLTAEAGEVAGKVYKVYRDAGGVLSEERRVALAAELGDVMWYVAALAAAVGLTLEDVAELNARKLADRAARGRINGDGDNR